MPADSGARISAIAPSSSELSDTVEDQETGLNEKIGDLMTSLKELHAKVDTLMEARRIKDWYTTADVAQIVGKSEYTVREWCRFGRINAVKRKSGGGPHAAWVISHDELQRYEREGLLQIPDLN
jgi:hypothetical protein